MGYEVVLGEVQTKKWRERERDGERGGERGERKGEKGREEILKERQ